MWTTALTWLLSKAWPFLWSRLKHLGVYIAMLLVIGMIAMKFHAFKLNLYDKGYKAGYSQALTDHPTNTVSSGGIVNYYSDKSGWLDFKVLRVLRIVVIPQK